MQPSVYNALAASIIVSAAGALTMCFLLFRYGFTTWAGGARRAVIIRLGHAFAGGRPLRPPTPPGCAGDARTCGSGDDDGGSADPGAAG
jgi:hypothetical protein